MSGENQPSLFSYHVFFFPFKWEWRGKAYADGPLEARTQLNGFGEKILGAAKWDSEAVQKNYFNWRRREFRVHTTEQYNEFNYFYDFVREILYDADPALFSGRSGSKSLLHHFEFAVDPAAEARYEIKVAHRAAPYQLCLEDITLNVYSSGVGVLAFYLANRKESQSAKEDILAINQFGRRLYPPFFAVDEKQVGHSYYTGNNFKAALAESRKKELAEYIKITWEKEDGTVKEHPKDFEDPYTSADSFRYTLFHLPPFIGGLLPNPKVVATTENLAASSEALISFSPVLDDRMFVLCWYGNTGLSGQVAKTAPGRDYLKYSFWYKFVFVDGGLKTCQDDDMAARLLESHTYTRWLNFGSLYGVSRYSFVNLTGSLAALRENQAAFTVQHIQSIYCKMVELCLVQRAIMLRFSDEVTHVSNLEAKDEKLSARVHSLYKQYIRFVNQIYFREVTAQEQGIELYNLLHEKMMLDKYVKDLEGEIRELHQYAMLLEQEKQAREAQYLTRIAAIFLPPTLLAGILGMNTVPAPPLPALLFSARPYWPFWASLAAITVISALIVALFRKWRKSSD